MARAWSGSRCARGTARPGFSSGSRSARFACAWAGPGHRPTSCGCGPVWSMPRTAPALELAQLYAQRWEHELYFREVKRQVRKTDLLAESHDRDGRPGNCRPRPGQRVARRRAAARRRRPAARPARELRENPGALCQTDVAVARLGARRAHRSATHPDHEARIRSGCAGMSRHRGAPAVVPGPCASRSRRGHGCCRRNPSKARCTFNSCSDVVTNFRKALGLSRTLQTCVNPAAARPDPRPAP